jgi:hypothetical protein
MVQKIILFIACIIYFSCKHTPNQAKASAADSTKPDGFPQSIGFHREGIGQGGYSPGKWYILTQNGLSAVSPEKPGDTLRLGTQLLQFCLPLWTSIPSMLKNQAEWGISESIYDGDGWKMIVKYTDQRQVTIFSGKLPDDFTQFEETVWKALIELEKNDLK